MATSCLQVMRESLDVERDSASLVPLMFSILAFFISASSLAMFQGLRYSNRIIGPTERLCAIMRRVKAGDLTVRAHLRRGDYLGELASELNSLIDWLNDNPPLGAKTGSDLVHFEACDDECEDEDADEVQVLTTGEEEPRW